MKRRETVQKSGPRQSPGFLLWHATLRWQRTLKAALAPLELTHVQFVLLASLRWMESVEHQAPSQRELADRTDCDIMMTSQVLRTLEKRALIRRTADQHDSRTKRLHMTKAGEEIAKEAVAIVEREDAAFFHPASAHTDLNTILATLADIDNILKEDLP